MVRVRNTLIGCWLAGLGTEILLFPLISVPSIKPYFLPGMGVLTAWWFGACLAALLFNSRIEKHIQQTFRSKNLTILGCWIDTLFAPASTKGFPQARARCFAEARAGLLEQLPLLTEEAAYLLRASERKALYQTFQVPDEELISVVLRAVPVLGDARALPFIRHLAEGKGMAATNGQLQAEAQISLSRLQTILDLSKGSQGLLRASRAPQTPMEQLLTPAQGNHETDPKELLRAEIQK